VECLIREQFVVASWGDSATVRENLKGIFMDKPIQSKAGPEVKSLGEADGGSVWDTPVGRR